MRNPNPHPFLAALAFSLVASGSAAAAGAAPEEPMKISAPQVLRIPGVGDFPAGEIRDLPPRRQPGSPTGKRMHKPFSLRMYYDHSSSTARWKATFTVGRVFRTVKIGGAVLTDVKVVSVRSVPKDSAKGRTEWEEVGFVYHTIHW